MDSFIFSLPKFENYNDVENWIKIKSKEYKGKNWFFCSTEYKNAYPIINKLYQIHKKNLHNTKVKNANIAMKESNSHYGDKVEWSYGDPYGNITIIEGQLIEKNNLPFVKDSNGKNHKWHKGFWKITS